MTPQGQFQVEPGTHGAATGTDRRAPGCVLLQDRPAHGHIGAVIGAVQVSDTPNRRPSTEPVDATQPAAGPPADTPLTPRPGSILELFEPDKALVPAFAGT